jgi:hypothetical protein
MRTGIMADILPIGAEGVGNIFEFDRNLKEPEPKKMGVEKDAEIERIQSLIADAKRAKQETETKWKRFKAWYKGNQWKKSRPKYKVSHVTNVLFVVVETVHSLWTDDLPRISIAPREAAQSNIASSLNRGFGFIQDKIALDDTISKILRDSCIYGSGMAKVIWDGGADDEKGEVDVKRISPFFIYPDPAAVTVEDCGYIIESKPMDIDLIKLNYPEHADDIKSEQIMGQSFLDYDDTGIVVDTQHDQGSMYIDSGQDKFSRNRAMVHEVWIKNLGLLLDELATVEDLQAMYSKYPNGRIITMVGDIVLADRAWVYKDGRYPFVKFDDYEDADEFWGIGEIEQIMPQQKEINKRSSQLIENAQLTANPPLMVDANSGVNIKLISNRAGLIFEKNPNTNVNYLIPPDVPQYVYAAQKESKNDVELVSGIYDLSNTQKAMSASALEMVTENSHTRIRDKVRQRNRSFADIAQLLLSRMAQFYAIPRQVRYLDDAGNYNFETLMRDDISGLWDVKIETGTGAPLSQTAIFNQGVTLFELGAIDAPALLDLANIPNADKILKRVEQRKQQQQQEQQGQQMQQQQMQMMQQQQQQQMQGQQQMALQQQKGQQQMQMEGMKALPQVPPPATPEGMPPEMGNQLMEMMNAAQKTGEIPPELEALLGQQQGGNGNGMGS